MVTIATWKLVGIGFAVMVLVYHFAYHHGRWDQTQKQIEELKAELKRRRVGTIL